MIGALKAIAFDMFDAFDYFAGCTTSILPSIHNNDTNLPFTWFHFDFLFSALFSQNLFQHE